MTVVLQSRHGPRTFNYDSVFGQVSSQEAIFEDTQRLIQSGIDGYNVCIFAYGQTGSGKTYTIEGPTDNPGVAPRAIKELFSLLALFPPHYVCTVEAYMVELYLDQLIDLFLPTE